MIPFASQRGLGQDLATHLMNSHDNERMELLDVRGSVAKDLHGAFAEWELQAHALTKCRNYLYSLSINPDPEQGPLTPEQYEDYITRVEDKLGLDGQPRAVVLHEKEGREHIHVVWSRIDTEAGKAIQMPFDREKLMMVTRQFAQDHDLKLPDGYSRDRQENRSLEHDQLSLYEKVQQEKSGVTKEERAQHVTEAWASSDNAKAFVQALEERGYILATGKRPYVLVDIYGEMNALPKLIKDKTVRTKEMRAFLKEDFPPEALPSVDEARKLAEQHRKAREAFVRSQRSQDKSKALQEQQAKRREKLEGEAAGLTAKQAAETLKLANRHQQERQRQTQSFAAKADRLKRAREENQPTGLSAFLGRITGMDFLRKAYRTLQDTRRRRQEKAERQTLKERQTVEHKELAFSQHMQRLAMARRLRALDRLEAREAKSLAIKQLASERTAQREGYLHLPPLGRRQRQKQSGRSEDGYYPDIENDFNTAAGVDRQDGKSEDSEEASSRDFRSIFKDRRDSRKKSPDKSSGKDKGGGFDR